MAYSLTTSGERDRVRALMDYNILDSLPEQDYDDITQLASEICQTPISLISLVDDSRQWFKSNHGLSVRETPKEFAFCTHTIQNPSQVFIVTDSREDERFAQNPLVTDDPNVIFYAGAPLIDSRGFGLGSLCVIDHNPRVLTENQLVALQTLAKHVVSMIELRKADRSMKTLQRAFEESHHETQKAHHLLKSDFSPQILSAIQGLESLAPLPDLQNKKDAAEKLGSAIQLLQQLQQVIKDL